jgi:hypothetical protein
MNNYIKMKVAKEALGIKRWHLEDKTLEHQLNDLRRMRQKSESKDKFKI